MRKIIPNPAKNAQFDSKNSSLSFKLTSEKFHLYLNMFIANELICSHYFSKLIQEHISCDAYSKLQYLYKSFLETGCILKTVVGIYQGKKQKIDCLANIGYKTCSKNLHRGT